MYQSAWTFAQTEHGPLVLAPPGHAELPSVVESLPETLAIPSTVEAASKPSPGGEAIFSPDQLEPPPVYAWYQPAYWFGPAPWDVGLQFGLNGSEGTNQSQSLQVGGHVKREATLWKHDANLTYNRNAANGIENQNNALLDARVDRKLDGTRWSLYVLNQTQYDEFQAYDLRVALNSGVGYQFIDTEVFDLGGKFGAGASREFGGPDDTWAPEALFGLNGEYLISQTQRLTAKVDYFPEWGDFGQYRIITDAGWEIDLDKPKNVSLKFSVNDRYDSTPNGVEPNLLNYAVLLIWGL
jgi:putative salt-induced outer membrane protein YdiY